MTDLLKSQLAALIRQGLTALGAFLVVHHIAQSDATALTAAIDPTALAGFAMTAGSVIWSLIHKKSVQTQLVVAAATGTTTAVPTASSDKALLAAGQVPPPSIPVKPV